MTTRIRIRTLRQPEPWPALGIRKKKNWKKRQHAEAQGWRIEVGGSHAWGKMYCPYNDAECRCGELCIASIWSTPKNPGNHARQLKRIVDNCQRNKASKADLE